MVDVSLQRYERGFLHWERAMGSVPNVGAQHPRMVGGGLELVSSVQHTSFPVAPAGRMFSWVS